MKTKRERCTSCRGSGKQECFFCGGRGKQRSTDWSSFPELKEVYTRCALCDGTGKRQCISCGGRGYLELPVIEIPEFKPIADISPVDIQLPKLTDTPAPTYISSEFSVFGCVAIIIALAVLGIFAAFGIERTLVAGEAFFILGGWAGLRAADLFHKQESETLEKFRVIWAIGFGLCAGILAAYLMLTTPEGQAITKWVTDQTIRVAGSLLVSVTSLGILDFAWREAFK
jgi:hypothetical protein